eukprot:TRINITY_DN4235_c0_g1_i3.p1 TRINITY_DN4235_c0_g1~~TRINITY_DN4235_c0_g1_i3.p1  ORF type:complete len:344 (-),score=27.29 TRINITY_DN4235_c0_g1_i3:3-1034(-)
MVGFYFHKTLLNFLHNHLCGVLLFYIQNQGVVLMKHILIALCGMSPTVITETLYELSPMIPDEVIVITTSKGRECLRSELLESGVRKRMLDSLNIINAAVLKDNQHHIRLIPHVEDGDAEDIDSDEVNAVMANFILDVLRQFTENPSCTKITFSIAGGRKTMSATGALAMSLLGREQDDLCHVLAAPPFDSPQLAPKFYFPTPGVTHKMPDGQQYSSLDANVSLCKIPYVRLRYLLTDHPVGDYADMVKLANARISSINSLTPMELIPKSCTCCIGEHIIQLSGFEFVTLWLLAKRRMYGEKDFHGTVDFRKEFLKFSKMIKKEIMPEMMAVRETLQSPCTLR